MENVNNKRRNKWLSIFVAVALIVGVIACSFIIFNSWKYPKLLNAQFTDLVASNNKEFFKQNALKEADIEVDLSALKYWDYRPFDLAPVEPTDVIGGIYIPKGNIKLPVALGVDKSYTANTAVTLQPDFSFDQTNVVLGTDNAKSNDFQQLSKGDEIYVTDKSKIYFYQVTKKIRSSVERVDLLLSREDNMLTLITRYDNEHSEKPEQLTIQAKLITSDEYNQANVGELFDVFGY